MSNFKAGYPSEVEQWFICKVEDHILPLYFRRCSRDNSFKWFMDNGRDFIEVEEPVEYGEKTFYVPTFNRF